jgi:two-component system, response regulator YesN
MEFRVLLAEDEPAAMRHIRTIIQRHTNDFNIVAEAEDGEEAFRKIVEVNPHILITDIRMPVYDGLELARKVKNQYPAIRTLIISGYQEFEYAQQAINHEVVRYLLKPINVEEFISCLEEIRRELESGIYNEIRDKIQMSLSLENVSHIHPGDRYFRLAVIRINGLHPRYTEKICHSPSVNAIQTLAELTDTQTRNKLFLFAGRDSREMYLFASKNTIYPEQFVSLVKEFGDRLPDCSYYTAAVTMGIDLNNPFPELQQLFTLLREQSRLGVSQCILKDRDNQIDEQNISLIPTTWLHHIVCNNDLSELSAPLEEWLHTCKQRSTPLSSIDAQFSHLIARIISLYPQPASLFQKSEHMRDILFREVKDYDELLGGFLNILEYIQCTHEKPADARNSHNAFEKITSYILNHLNEEILVTDLCSLFCLSQSYLNKLFHRYENTSVVRYIQKERIRRSIEVMTESPETPLHIVAESVGYDDSSYFSRVFKKQTGVSPRQYLHRD